MRALRDRRAAGRRHAQGSRRRAAASCAPIERERLWRAQTPQGFPREVIVRAHRDAKAQRLSATDDAALVRATGNSRHRRARKRARDEDHRRRRTLRAPKRSLRFPNEDGHTLGSVLVARRGRSRAAARARADRDAPRARVSHGDRVRIRRRHRSRFGRRARRAQAPAARESRFCFSSPDRT